MRAGLVGCGIVGRTIGQRLLKATHNLKVHDTRESQAAPLLESGATWAATSELLAVDCELVITCLPDQHAVERASLGSVGLQACMPAGATQLDLSTVGPACARRLAQQAAKSDVHFLDGTLSAGQLTKEGMQLVMWVGGHSDHFDQARGLLDPLADKITYCGPAGNGQLTKLINNLVTQSLTVILGEALTLGVKAGVPLEILRIALHQGTAQSRLLDEMLPLSLFRGDWKPGFRLELAAKDMRLAQGCAQELGLIFPLTDKITEIYEEACRRGWAELSAHAVVRLAEEAADVSLRSP